MSSKSIFLLAIIMGGITTLLFNNYLKNSTAPTAAIVTENTVEIIVAAEPLKKNERITAEKLEFKTIPESALHPQTLMTKEELEGLFVTADMQTGEAFFSHRVQSEEDEKLFISRKVKPGYRAVSVSVNYVESVSTLTEPEDLVDIIFTETIEKEDKEEIVTKLLFEKVRVLAVGRKMVEPTSPESYSEYSTVTLELTPADAIKIVNVSERGSIHLMLNSRIDEPSDNSSK
ncbi:Flp pilus assembly protein CpaB [Anaerobacillus alkaliphilus]|uniref:Flp pilus assembly protein CpaB n=1 Tax=Anaerobacillus alkaliphilus TaxID=1548597 RepID=A0A4Q0VTI5_9BACI|nr:Flp pilus assembly protein CpaB [Anaerobacillus alkaliphilus]RXJ01906.1 Flp pilus assembly protein CpaB [Anaerobacillus alkaliphilus]